ncbi:MAG: hypothetical protein HZB11_01910 [Candidatus Yonathbacteria bacterium]|nr:hypothetical protein [Candidatus Yonathbacteria bacterium]
MTTAQINNILNKGIKTQKIGKMPVVVLPLQVLETMRERFSMLEEYYQMSTSKNYKQKIARARASKKEISAKDLYKKLVLA